MPFFESKRTQRTHKEIKFMKKKQNIQNQEQLFSLEQKDFKQIYMCPCGKQYSSFPATYLHFRSKHGIKLSTRPSQKRKTVEILGNLKRITYTIENQQVKESNLLQIRLHNIISSQQNKSSELNPQVKAIQNYVMKYLIKTNQKSKEVLEYLIQFLNRQKDGSKEQNYVTISKVPLFLNNFCLFYLPKCQKPIEVGSRQWNKSCYQLKQFCDWLRQQNQTELFVFWENL